MFTSKLEWEDKYSVGVKIIDDQHKKMFETINYLIDSLANPNKEEVDKIVKALIDYKKFHFATEEKFFNEFNYEFKEEHEQKHREFSKKLEEMIKESSGDSLGLAFKLVDFLEDWLIDHLMTEDRKYIECFKAHGLK